MYNYLEIKININFEVMNLKFSLLFVVTSCRYCTLISTNFCILFIPQYTFLWFTSNGEDDNLGFFFVICRLNLVLDKPQTGSKWLWWHFETTAIYIQNHWISNVLAMNFKDSVVMEAIITIKHLNRTPLCIVLLSLVFMPRIVLPCWWQAIH